MVDVVVLGHILNEKIVFPDKEIYPVLGSPVAYSSVCIAFLGVDVGIVTKIGKNFPQELLAVFKETGVNTEGIKVCENSTNNELIYDNHGNKTLNFLSKAEKIGFEDIPENYRDAKLFLVSPMDYEITINTIKEIYKLGKIMAVDIGGYGGGTSDSHPSVKDGHELREMCPYFNIVKGSIEDYRHIFGNGINESFISGKIVEWGAEISIVTLGEKGSFIKNMEKEKYIPAYPVEKYLDQTGAGDCYFAGFLTKFLNCGDAFESAIYGTATTSYIIERSGGVIAERMPDLTEVEARASNLVFS